MRSVLTFLLIVVILRAFFPGLTAELVELFIGIIRFLTEVLRTVVDSV